MSTTASTASHRYERWSGTPSSGRWTWLAIVATGFRLGYKKQEVRFFFFVALGFLVGACLIFYLLSVVEELGASQEARGIIEFLRSLLGVDLSAATNLQSLRRLMWSLTFLFASKAQLVLVLLIAASIGPGLIADDLKARALPVYFARPVRPWNYILGKGLVLAIFICGVTMIPNLLALIMGTLLTGGLATWGQTLEMAAKLIVIGMGVTILVSSLMLMLSSLGSDKRLVTIGWLALCMIPMAAQKILSESLPASKMTGFLGSLALNRDVAVLIEWIFELRQGLAGAGLPADSFGEALGPALKPQYPAIVLSSLVIFSIVVCYRRVIRFSRAAANV